MNTNKIDALRKRKEELERELDAVEHKLSEEDRIRGMWVRGDEAQALLDTFSDPWAGEMPVEKFADVLQTLVSLRPPADRVAQYYLYWEEPRGVGQFHVSVATETAEVLLNDDWNQVAHSLDVEDARVLGMRLLGAAEAAENVKNTRGEDR